MRFVGFIGLFCRFLCVVSNYHFGRSESRRGAESVRRQVVSGSLFWLGS